MTNDETSLRKEYARRIASAWRKSVAAIIEAGRILVEAKTKLKPGTFMEMIQADLGFDLSTAERLMKIARTSWLVESANLPILPAAWTTLYALSQLSKREFDRARELGWVRADMSLAEAEKLKPHQKIDEASRARDAHVCNVVQFEKPDDVVELTTGVEIEREQVPLKAQATIILGYLQLALNRIERCDDDDDQEQLVDAIIKHAHFQDTIDALDRVLALLKQAADDRPKPSLAVNNDAASPLHG
jgi:Protein of unknown function (DUF3102)